jgi:anti-sigma B factor antagonist
MVNVELRTRVSDGYVVVALCGELDTADAESVAAAVAALAKGGQQLIIDLEAPGYLDCHSVCALLGVRETARQAGGDLLLAAPRGVVLRMLTLAGVSGVLASVAAAAETPAEGTRGPPPGCLRSAPLVREGSAVSYSVPDDGGEAGRPGARGGWPGLGDGARSLPSLSVAGRRG